MISDPLCLYDCDIAVDGATAVVVSHASHAPDTPSPPIRVEAVGSALHGRASWDQWEDMTTTAAASAGAHLWSRTDLTPGDVDVAQLYDGFTVLTLFWLEGLQFCGKGESGAFVEGGERIGLDGELPLSTSGGQLSGGRLHSFGHLYEACVQLRGVAGERQVPGAQVAAVSAGAGPLASCLLLTAA
jgi:acetyl-CoA acetyltransferase